MARNTRNSAPVEPEGPALRDPVEVLTKRLSDGFTETQDHFGDWMLEQLNGAGQKFGTNKESDAFVLGAKVALLLRNDHQKSPEAKALRAARSSAEPAPTAKPARRSAKAAEAPAEKPAPARRTAKAKAAEVAPEAPKPTRRRSAAAATAEPEVAAPTRAGGRRRSTAAATESAPATKTAAKSTTRPAATGRPGRARRAAEAEF